MSELIPSTLRRPVSAGQENAKVLIEPIVTEEETSLLNYWWVIRRRLWLVIICCLATALPTAFVVQRKIPIYTAWATLLLERNAPQVLNIKEIQLESQGSDEYDFYRTQFEILRSRTLAAQVIQEQGLGIHDFWPRGEEKEGGVAYLWAQAKEWVTQQEWVRWFFALPLEANGENSEASGEDQLDVERTLVDTYMGMLQITPVMRTRLVKIVFNTPAPELSPRLANAHAQAYIRHGIGLRIRANEEAQHFLQGRLEELKRRIEESEAALNNYSRGRTLIFLDEKQSAGIEHLTDLNKQLTAAEVERLGLEAQLRVIRKRDYDVVPALSANPLVQALKQQLAQREGEAAQLSTLLMPGHPRLERMKTYVEETRRKVREEIDKVVKGIESTYLATVEKERALRDKIRAQKMESFNLKDARVQYDILTREVDTNRQLYDSVLQRMREIGVAAELRVSNVSIIDNARLPLKPNITSKKYIFIAALMGLIGGQAWRCSLNVSIIP